MAATDLHFCTSTLQADPMSLMPDDVDGWLAALPAAGVTGVSFWSLHHMVLSGTGVTADEMLARFGDAGLTVSVIEAIFGWGNAESPDAAVKDSMFTFDIASAYGAQHVAAVVLEPELRSMDEAVANLTAVADAAAQSDLNVCVEYLPWSGVPDIGTCWELLRRTERSNVGFLFDSWHWHRQPGGDGPANQQILASIPGEFIKVFQICDAQPDAEDDAMAECMARRPVPGAGVIDHATLLALFDEIGADPLVTPEVFNAELITQGPEVFARTVADASRAVLSR